MTRHTQVAWIFVDPNPDEGINQLNNQLARMELEQLRQIRDVKAEGQGSYMVIYNTSESDQEDEQNAVQEEERTPGPSESTSE